MNIVALATAYGAGAVSIVRLSGKNALDIALKLCKTELKPRYAHLKKLYSSENEILDEAIVIYFKAPFSYTGEDVVEFQTHGGLVVANMLIDELLKLGARAANPGEFTKRAYLNGKIDLSKAESIQAIIDAKSEGAAKILARSMSGELENFVNDLRLKLIKILAHTEVCIDYADDDLPSDILENIKTQLLNASNKLSNIVEISRSKRGLIDGYKIAIIGKPNVGKSSLLNSILHYERAIVSSVAGTTRDSVEEQIKIGSHLVRIIDTAGIRKNADELENIGITYSKRAAKEADIIVCVFDGSNKADHEDEQILELAKSFDKKIFYVMNKADLENNFDKNLNNPIIISAKTDAKPLLKQLNDYLNSQDISETMLSSNRQILACEEANEAIKRAFDLLNENQLEIFAYEVKDAIVKIASITKPMENDELLDAMFGEFCLGK